MNLETVSILQKYIKQIEEKQTILYALEDLKTVTNSRIFAYKPFDEKTDITEYVDEYIPEIKNKINKEIQDIIKQIEEL